MFRSKTLQPVLVLVDPDEARAMRAVPTLLGVRRRFLEENNRLNRRLDHASRYHGTIAELLAAIAFLIVALVTIGGGR